MKSPHVVLFVFYSPGEEVQEEEKEASEGEKFATKTSSLNCVHVISSIVVSFELSYECP